MIEEKKELYCSECGTKIEDEYYKCLDNYLQIKFFDTDAENCFCSKSCFCKYMSLEQLDKNMDMTEAEKDFAEIVTKNEEI